MNSNECYNAVNEVLRTNFKARNDYNELVLSVLVKLNYAERREGCLFIRTKFQFNFPSFETITRVAREIQNKEGRYIPSKQVQEFRESKRNAFQKNRGASARFSGMSILS